MIEYPLIAVSTGTSLLTLIGLYLGWRSFRVFLLRLRLLEIRNDLWDRAYDGGVLEDEVVRQVRDRLNLMIRHAHRIDLITLALTTPSRKHTSADEFLPKSNNPLAQDAVELSISQVVGCMTNYMVWHRPFTGVLLIRVLDILFRTVKGASFVRSIASSAFGISVAQVRNFGNSLDSGTRRWLEQNGSVNSLPGNGHPC